MDITPEVASLLSGRISKKLECRPVLPASHEIGQIVGLLASTGGGFLILGLVQSLGRITVSGLSDDFRPDAMVRKALALLSPQPVVYHQYVSFQGKRLYAIKVEHSNTPVLMEDPANRQSNDAGLLFSWIHISDLHFGHGDAAHSWDQVLVTSTLQRDVAATLGKGIPSPDAILVTGDIAFSGDVRPRPDGQPSQEYADARRFLLALGETTGLDAGHIFVVPGNHDIQRTADRSPGIKRLRNALRDGREPLDNALIEPEDRAALAKRQAHFLAFAAGFAPACLDEGAPAVPAPRLWWWCRVQGRSGIWLRLIGLNTALLAADDQDRGKLALGKAPLADVLTARPIEADELVVVLSHHPFHGGWLRDAQEANAWVRSHAHVHLFGHVHEADSEEARLGSGGAIVRVAAGAAHGEQNSPAAHGYNLAAVLRMPNGELRLRLWPRRWSSKNKAFRPDADNLPEGQMFTEHVLQQKRVG